MEGLGDTAVMADELNVYACRAQHGARVVVAANGDDLPAYDMNVLRERNWSEGRVDAKDRDTVLAVNDEAKHLDAFDDLREWLQGLNESLGASIGIHWEYADHVRM